MLSTTSSTVARVAIASCVLLVPAAALAQESGQAPPASQPTGEPAPAPSPPVESSPPEGSPLGFDLAKARYAEEFLWFDEVYIGTDADELASEGRGAVVYRGWRKTALEGRDLYVALGRDDLAASYTRRQVFRWSLVGVGVALALAGPVYVAAANEDCPGKPDFRGCLERGDRRLALGGAIIGAGTVVVIAGLFVNPNPISPNETRRLANEHNVKLRRKLGLPEGYHLQSMSRPPASIQLAPIIGPEVAGIAMTGTF